MKKSPFIAFGLIFLLFACEKEIAFRDHHTAPKITLNSLLTPDSAVSLHLLKSRFFLSESSGFTLITNATVTLFKDDAPLETLRETDPGRYRADYHPQIGDRLRITAKAAGLEAVECSTQILPSPHIVAAEMTAPASPSEYSDYDLTLTFSDPAATTDYYRIYLYTTAYDEKNDQDYRQRVSFSSDDIIFGTTTGDDFFSENENYYFAFTDQLFNGKDYKLNLHLDHVYRPDPSNNPLLCVELQHLTKDYYLYLRSRDAASGIGDLGGIFAEPAQIFTNIRGGIGILGSYTATVYPIPL
jgi:hypothetical protein